MKLLYLHWIPKEKTLTRVEYHSTLVDVLTGTIETLRFFVFERTKHQPRRNLRSYLVLQRPCNEAALSPGIDAFWY